MDSYFSVALATLLMLLEPLRALIEAYEAKRWPLGKDPKVPGGK